MRRLILPALAAVMLTTVACGDGADKEQQDGTPTGAASSPTPPVNVQPTPDRPFPTPTPIRDAGLPVVTVTGGASSFAPTAADFKSLPTVTVAGKTGVTLAALASQVGATGEMTVTLEGFRPDLSGPGFVRRKVSEISTNTVFYLDDNGHITLASSGLPEGEWLKAINGISFTP